MRIFVSLSVILLFVSTAAIGADQCQTMPDRTKEACREIEAAYQRLSAAIAKKDMDAIRAIFDPDYTEIQTSGMKLGFSEAMAQWQNALAAALDPSFQVTIERIDVEGNDATIAARVTQALVHAPETRIRVETVGRDRWTKRESGWRLRQAEYQSVKTWINDKLVQETNAEPPLAPAERAAILRDLAAHAQPFDTVLAGNGFDDLAGLDRLIGDARIVALGEASHGTAEFFQMKHRLLQYLVEKKGFTVFSIEANWPEALVADRYIKAGEGDAAAALAAMYFWTWQTEEVRAMLDWMRAYNARRGEWPALSFSSFDMQTAAVALRRVTDAIARVGGADQEAIARFYAEAGKLDRDEISAPDAAGVRDNAAKALDLLVARREVLLPVWGAEDYRDVLQAARIVLQAAEMKADPSAWGRRDQAMAANTRWLAEERFPGQKIVLWAHNGHVGATPGGGEKSMGDHLRAFYGDQMVVLGFASEAGEVRAHRMTAGALQSGGPFALPLAPANPISVEGLASETGLPRFILDFRHLPENGPLAQWLAKPRLHRSIGSVYDPDRPFDCYVQVKLRETYDGLIFISQSTAAKPIKMTERSRGVTKGEFD